MGDGIDGFDEPLGILYRNKILSSSKDDTIYMTYLRSSLSRWLAASWTTHSQALLTAIKSSRALND